MPDKLLHKILISPYIFFTKYYHFLLIFFNFQVGFVTRGGKKDGTYLVSCWPRVGRDTLQMEGGVVGQLL